MPHAHSAHDPGRPAHRTAGHLTGKTTELSRILSYHAHRVGGENVIAISHTRAAAAELAGRNTPLPLDNIATLHALAFRALDKPPVAETREHLTDFSNAYPDMRMGISLDPDEATFVVGGHPGDILMTDYARLRNVKYPNHLWPTETLRFAKLWDNYKRDTGTVDFTDMIELAATETACPVQDPHVIVLDEAQDTSRLQWQLLQRWTSAPRCEKWITAGDELQAIYGFAGATPEWFRENPPAREKVLGQSYRVPRAVYKLARDWVGQITNQPHAEWAPRDYPGTVARNTGTHRYIEPLLPIIEEHLANGKSVMVMASCSYMLSDTVTAFRKRAWPFANPWRRKRADWNPLYQHRGSKTLPGLKAFIAPHSEGRFWTPQELEAWIGLVKGVFPRGARKTLLERVTAMQENREADSEVLMNDMLNLLKDPQDFGRMLASPPDCLDWLEQRVLAAKQGALAYPLQIVRKHGPAALDEAPRLYIGSCHSFKGSEADVVIVFPDLSYNGYTQWLSSGKDEIIRLFYVAFTRARETLILCNPASEMAVWT